MYWDVGGNSYKQRQTSSIFDLLTTSKHALKVFVQRRELKIQSIEPFLQHEITSTVLQDTLGNNLPCPTSPPILSRIVFAENPERMRAYRSASKTSSGRRMFQNMRSIPSSLCNFPSFLTRCRARNVFRNSLPRRSLRAHVTPTWARKHSRDCRHSDYGL